jgi:HSP20 family protein
MLTDWENPWDSLRKLHDEMSRTFEDKVFGARFLPAFVRRYAAFPKVNLAQTPDKYILTCELPGVDPEALDLSLNGRELTIKGERFAPEGTDRRYDRHERGCGPFSRTVELPGPVEPGAPNASLKHGVLTVELTRSPQSKPRQIQVKSTES